jgi:hypothetical protein
MAHILVMECRLVAHLRLPAMSAVWSLSDGKRTLSKVALIFQGPLSLARRQARRLREAARRALMRDGSEASLSTDLRRRPQGADKGPF